MKKIISVLLLMALLVPCALAESNGDMFLKIADEMAGRIVRKASDTEFVKLYVEEEEALKLLEDIGTDWIVPENRQRAAVVTVNNQAIDTLTAMVTLLTGLKVNVRDIYDTVAPDIPETVSSVFSGREGMMWVVLTAATGASDVRLVDGAEPGLAFVLMDYGPEHPKIYVGFYIGEDGAASIFASLLNLDNELVDLIFAGKADVSDLVALLPDSADEEDSQVLPMYSQIVPMIGELLSTIEGLEISVY